MDNIQIETAQNVQLKHQIATLGDRILAYIVDILIIIVYEIMMTFLLLQLNFGNFSSSADFWVLFMVLGLPPFLYHLMMETFNNGQSIGKAALKIRVVSLDGTAPHFSNYLIRWVLRIIDISLSSGAVAIFSLLLSGKGQRLGDMAAKTTVISEKQYLGIEQTLMVEVPVNYVPVYPQVTIFTDRDMQQIKSLYYEARAKGNFAVIEALAQKTGSLMEIQIEDNPRHFLETVLKDYNFYTQQ